MNFTFSLAHPLTHTPTYTQTHPHTHTQDLRLPMICLVDYFGFRLIAISLLPIDSSTLIYGTCDAGRTIHSKDDKFAAIMQKAGERLHLASHHCGAMKSNLPVCAPSLIHTYASTHTHTLTNISFSLFSIFGRIPPRSSTPPPIWRDTSAEMGNRPLSLSLTPTHAHITLSHAHTYILMFILFLSSLSLSHSMKPLLPPRFLPHNAPMSTRSKRPSVTSVPPFPRGIRREISRSTLFRRVFRLFECGRTSKRVQCGVTERVPHPLYC